MNSSGMNLDIWFEEYGDEHFLVDFHWEEILYWIHGTTGELCLCHCFISLYHRFPLDSTDVWTAPVEVKKGEIMPSQPTHPQTYPLPK